MKKKKVLMLCIYLYEILSTKFLVLFNEQLKCHVILIPNAWKCSETHIASKAQTEATDL